MILKWLGAALSRLLQPRNQERKPPETPETAQGRAGNIVSLVLFIGLTAGLLYGAWKLIALLRQLSLHQFTPILIAGGWTLSRVLVSTALGTLWTLPAGLAIGLSPKWSRIFQPIVQVAASFPAPMLFPLVIALLKAVGVSLGWGSVVLMLLGTQWYILFNVIAGAMAIPADLREAADSYRMDRWLRFHSLYLPAVFPYLVTGWVTAAGGAWNASIVAEYIDFTDPPLAATGLGARIMEAAGKPDYPMLAASVMVMSTVVVLFNRLVWRRFYRLAEERYSLNK